MACVTLKRPLEWIDPSMSADAEPSGSSSPTSMIISNSPPHSGSVRSPKRLCTGHGFSGSSPSYYHNSTYHHNHHYSSNGHSSASTSASPHSSSSNTYFKPIPSVNVAEQIRGEIRRLRFVRHRASSSVASNSTSAVASSAAAAAASTSSASSASTSANASTSTSSKTAATSSKASTQSKREHDDDDVDVSGKKSPSPSESSMSSGGDLSPSSSPRHHISSNSAAYNLYNSLLAISDISKSSAAAAASSESSSTKRARTSSNAGGNQPNKPLFTFEQVVMIVERLLRDREDVIRQEYEQTLTTRLAEQYDQFVKFSYDQIQRRFDSQALPSYLS